MPPVVQVRELIAAKSAIKEAKTSTPLWKQKLRAQTTTPLTTKLSLEHRQVTNVTSQELSKEAAPIATGDTDAEPQLQSDAAAAPTLKLTVIHAPLLPKPELVRPELPADRALLLQQLHDLRAAGASMLTAQTSADGVLLPNLNLLSHGTTLSAGVGTHGPFSSAMAPSPQPAAAWPQAGGPPLLPQRPAGFGSVGTATDGTQSAFPHPFRTPQAVSSPPPGASGLTIITMHACGARHPAQSYNPLSTPSMAGLRQQELKDTGGGFLTHYADPGVLATPQPAAAAGGGMAGCGYGVSGMRAGGGGGLLSASSRTPAAALSGMNGVLGVGAAGSTTPMSDIRSIHAVARLQLLRREGAQLVAALGGSES